MADLRATLGHMHILLIQAPNWAHPMPFGPFESAEVADSFAEKLRQENELPRELTEAAEWSFGVHQMTTVVPRFGGPRVELQGSPDDHGSTEIF